MAVHIEHQGHGVYTATLDAPSRRNALNTAMFETLSGTLESISSIPGSRVLVIKGSEGFFCSGRDLGELKPEATPINELLAPIVRLAKAFRSCALPTIAFVQGKAVGLGVSLTCWSDIAIATEDSVFSLPEAKAGISPSITAVSLIEAIGRRQALHMCLTGKPIDAQTAVSIGLVHYVCEPYVAESCLDSVLDSLLMGGPQALRLTKELCIKTGGMTSEEANSTATLVAARSLENTEVTEGIRAFKEKRKPSWYQMKITV